MNNKYYKSLVINDILFKNVLLFIYEDGHLDVVDSWSGITIATVKKKDIKTIIYS